MPTQTLRPNGAGYYQEFEYVIDTTHWGATSDQSDATYITAVGLRRDIQALQDPTFGDADTVNSVQIFCRAKAFGTSTPERIDFWDRLGTIDRDQGNSISVSRVAFTQYNSTVLTTAPDGGAWTKQKVVDLQAGIQVAVLGSGEEMSVSEIWIVVNYTPAVTETIVAKDFPISYLQMPVKAKELISKVTGATKVSVSKDFPDELLKSGKAKELKSKFTA